MKSIYVFLGLGIAFSATLLSSEDLKPATIVKALKERSERGTLSDRRELVRGDSGKWNDAAKLQPMPPIQQKPPRMSLDDWADELLDKKITNKTNEDNWLIFRTRQLDDNDRVWVETIERKGNEFTIVLSEAIWQGNYRKTFTYYEVVAVNLGPLPPGDYRVKWQVKPLTFTRFEDPGKPQDNWPKDERPTAAKPVELQTKFSVQ